jgi:hypothetical protein
MRVLGNKAPYFLGDSERQNRAALRRTSADLGIQKMERVER